jgi:hypothetical protein
MGVLNNIFKWIILERIKEIDEFSRSPHSKQERLLEYLVQNSVNTEWGKYYDYKRIRNYKEFAEKVPLQDYNSLKPYIERMMTGEQNIVWPTDINWFAKSSGTTDDKSKFIPVSKESMMDCHYKAGKDMYAMYYNQYPNANLVDGKSLVLGGSHQVNKLNEDSYFGDLSAVLMQNLPTWAEAKRTPVLSIALMDNWEEKIEKMAKAILKQKVTNVLGIPTWTTILFRRILEMTGKSNISEIWPMLELYVHGGVSFDPYRNLFKELLPSDNMHYMETYNASEGFFAIQDSAFANDMLLMLDYGIFYEFIPVDGSGQNENKPIPLEDVELNKNYALVISTNSGLWRYKIGDTIRFTSKDPYRIKISGRTKHYINAFGEELMIENAEKALAIACEHTNSIIADFTAAPVFFSRDGNGAHEWLIEFEKDPKDFQEFVHHLDETLKQLNSDYEAKRFKDMALQGPIVRKLLKGTFYEWMKKRGKLGGQNKVPRLSNSREFVDDILEFVNHSE